MNKISIIILREFTTRIRKKSFIILTILMPFLMAGIVAVPILLGQLQDDEQVTVAVVDQTGLYKDCLPSNAQYRFVFYDKMTPALRSDTAEVEAVLQITDDLAQHPEAAFLASHKELQLNMTEYIEQALAEKVRHDKVAAYDIPELEGILHDMEQDFTLTTLKWDSEGNESETSGDVAMMVGFLSTFLIYMFVMSYGGMVMQGVTEEKTNRIVEIMVSSVKPFQLMMGKIIGVAFVGFVQIAIWGVMLAIIFATASYFLGADSVAGAAAAQSAAANTMPAAQPSGTAEAIAMLGNIPLLELGIIFVLMFVGGYLLYASFFAAVGASVNTQEDSAQFTMPVIFVMVFGMYAAMGSAGNTDGPLAFWSSMFPLTSPIVMMVRIPFGVPLWQEVLSLALLFGTAFAMIWLAGKIYRVGILMYGKKPSIKEMAKWIRYK